MPYAVTPEDVAARWRPLDDSERAVATVLLQDAEVLLNAKMPTLAARYTAGTVDARLVTIVLAEMVQRVLRNPDVQSSLQLGADGSIGQSFPTATVNVARPRLDVTEYDLAMLTPVVALGQASTGIYSVPYGAV